MSVRSIYRLFVCSPERTSGTPTEDTLEGARRIACNLKCRVLLRTRDIHDPRSIGCVTAKGEYEGVREMKILVTVCIAGHQSRVFLTEATMEAVDVATSQVVNHCLANPKGWGYVLAVEGQDAFDLLELSCYPEEAHWMAGRAAQATSRPANTTTVYRQDEFGTIEAAKLPDWIKA